MLIPLDRILFPPNVPAGMDPAVIGLWVCRFRKTAEPCDPQIIVRHAGQGFDGAPIFQLVDGRHRVTAAIQSGRTHIEAEEE